MIDNRSVFHPMTSRLVWLSVFLAASLQAQYWQPDTGFAPVIESSSILPAVSLVAAPGGRVLIAQLGDVDSVNGVRRTLVRLNADGSNDPSFSSPEGRVLVPLLAYPDGRVLVLRSTDTTRELVRLKADGAVDPLFSPVNVGPALVAARLLSGGRILLSGTFLTVGGVSSPVVCVLNADGSIAPDFHSPVPAVPIATGDGGGVQAVALSDGRILLAGQFSPIGDAKLRSVVRLMSDGTVDPSFNANAVPFPAPVGHVYPKSDGSVWVTFGPDIMSIGAPSGIYRLTATGAWDASFQPAVTGLFVDFGPAQSDGRLIYRSYNQSTLRYELRRLQADGSADATFAPVAAELDLPLPLPVLSDDGTLVIASPVTSQRRATRSGLTRVRSDGVIDDSYAPRVSAVGRVNAAARQPDGKLVLAGPFDYVNGVKQGSGWAIVRLNADGSTDTGFSASAAGLESIDNLVVTPGGDIVLSGLSRTLRAGSSGSAQALAEIAPDPWRVLLRLAPDGSRKPGPNPIVPTSIGRSLTRDLAVDDLGRFYLTAADLLGRLELQRNLPDGSEDGTFSGVPLGGAGVFAVGASGDVFVTSDAPGGSGQITLTHYLATRVVDPAFAVSPAALPQTVLALVALSDGGVLAIGSTSAADGSALECVRFSAAGVATYRYRKRQIWGVSGPTGVQDIAGVLFDTLRSLSSPSSLRAEIVVNGSATSVEVTRDGRLIGLTPTSGGRVLQAQRRTSLTSPSVDAAPVVSVLENLDPGTIYQGGGTVLRAVGDGLAPFRYQWARNGVPIAGATSDRLELRSAKTTDDGSYTVTITNDYGSITSAPLVVQVYAERSSPSFMNSPQLQSRVVAAGDSLNLTVEATGNPLPLLHWRLNDQSAPRGTVTTTVHRTTVTSSLALAGFQPGDAGVYLAVAENEASQVLSAAAIIGARIEAKVTGAGREVSADVTHPNGRIFDQLLLEGAVASITADAGQVSRLSFVDLDDDIVQVEFSGAGTLTLRLSASSGPAAPANYAQPGVSYMKGHATIVVVGADETTNLSVFSVGRANALNPSLFRTDVSYDGIADLACIGILSANGRFGSLRCANASFFGSQGLTGILAPGVQFTGPVYVGDITAFDQASPVLLLGGADGETLVTGGDLSQTNNQPVKVSGLTRLRFTDGATSHAGALPAQRNKAVLRQNGWDVTAQIVVNP